jgi:N-acetylglucosaminyldiphosphoundecaprenol N-acetyl-beta-D-mannosaminyltransferase
MQKRIRAKELIKKDGESVTILNTRIDSTSTSRVLSKVEDTIKKNTKCFIVTPNPEILLQAQKDIDLRDALNSSDISSPDGIGILKAEEYLKRKSGILNLINSFYRFTKPQGNLNLVKGRDLFVNLIKAANEKNWKVVLIGNRKGSAKKAKSELEKKWRNVKLYAFEGANLTLSGDPVTNEDTEIEKFAISSINKIHPQLIFVGFGAPRQEKWLHKRLSELKCNVGMVVGGTFDYISKSVPIPPHWWPSEMEWLWRLLTQFRFRRIWNAVFVFPIAVKDSLKQNRK